MIFDKEGRLLDAKAPRPSETKIEELFNRWKPISSYQVSGNLKTPSDTLLVAYVNTQTGRTKLDTVPSNAGAFGFDALDKNTTYAVGIIGKPKYGDVQGLMAAMFSPIRLVIIPGEKAVVTGDFRNYEITRKHFLYRPSESQEGVGSGSKGGRRKTDGVKCLERQKFSYRCH